MVRRALCFIFDIIIVSSIYVFIFFSIKIYLSSDSNDYSTVIWFYIFLAIVYLCYFVIIPFFYVKTLGYKLFALKLVGRKDFTYLMKLFLRNIIYRIILLFATIGTILVIEYVYYKIKNEFIVDKILKIDVMEL